MSIIANCSKLLALSATTAERWDTTAATARMALLRMPMVMTVLAMAQQTPMVTMLGVPLVVMVPAQMPLTDDW